MQAGLGGGGRMEGEEMRKGMKSCRDVGGGAKGREVEGGEGGRRREGQFLHY
jgi:hypothetical protein